MFDYDLPPDRIAQHAAEPRDAARLMVVDRAAGEIRHHVFRDLPDLLTPGDLLVLNDTRVLHARLLGKRAATGGGWEGLFLRETPDGLWEMLCQTRGRLTAGEAVAVEPGPLRLTLEGRAGGHFLFRPSEPGPAAAVLERYGQVPLPPYIRKGRAEAADAERYQTVYAERPGSVAAPTAGLHFTPAVFERLRERGVGRTSVTLHVGLGTFEAIKADDPAQHVMHREWCEVSPAAAAAVNECRRRGGRVVAVGTTATRTLETAARQPGVTAGVAAFGGETGLFVRPGDRFRAVDALVTNFHLPRTTLLLLVAALAGEGLLARAYRAAVEEGYRFYSYGDAMLVV